MNRNKMVHDIRSSVQDLASLLQMIEMGYRFDDEDADALRQGFAMALQKVRSFVENQLAKELAESASDLHFS